MDDHPSFNYHSLRSAKARVSVKINKTTYLIGQVLTVIMFVGAGMFLVLLHNTIGWLLLSMACLLFMLVSWYNGDLRHLEVVEGGSGIDDVLSAEVLGRLSKTPTPKELVGVLSNLLAGQFFAIRFGVGKNLLEALTESSEVSLDKIWLQAIKVQQQTKSKNVSAVVLIVAIAEVSPLAQQLLAPVHLTVKDLYQGIYWYNHLRQLTENYRKPARNGGIARDWAFGWTPLLKKLAQNISTQIDAVSLLTLESHDEAVKRLIGIFSKNGRQNALLIGGSGSGKTRVVHSFAARLIDGYSQVPSNLKYRQVFVLNAASLLAVSREKGDLERIIPQVLMEAYSAKNIILCLDDAHLFFEDGVGSVDISNILLPIISSGRLRIILAVDEQRFLQINQRNPELANALNKIMVAPATQEETIAIMQDRAVLVESQNQTTYTYQALVEAYKLGDRYIYDIVMPGRGLKVMEASSQYSESNGLVTTKSVQQAVEKTLDVKVGVAHETDERQTLLNLEDLIHQKMINQNRAVSVVSDALRRARSGVRNQNRPIGTFLFLGPTGVGKTELAKALARTYFGGESQIIRLDMNSFVTEQDVQRLLADGADYPASLTAQVMKQPFSVVLLDEIEKAHDKVLVTLLQLLDEGVLRDVKNREVSFRDTIIIGTSNAGADRIRELIDRGLDIERMETFFVDELIKTNQFRPEFVNRFDEVVMFRPLTKDELLQVVELMVGAVNETLANQKIAVAVDLEVKKLLIEKGYDPRLGARPMRRMIQRTVENVVAKQVLSDDVKPGDTIHITLDQIQRMLGDEE